MKGNSCKPYLEIEHVTSGKVVFSTKGQAIKQKGDDKRSVRSMQSKIILNASS